MQGSNAKAALIVRDVQFTGGKWSIHHIKTTIEACDLSNMKFKFHQSSKKKQGIEIKNTKLGNMVFHHVHHAILKDCEMRELADNNSTHLTFKHSTAKVLNSMFTNNTGNAVIAALKGTHLRLQNVTFRGNKGLADGGCLNVWERSKVNIADTKFIDNTAAHSGAAIYASRFVSMNITDCTFFRNSAKRAGAIVTYDNTLVEVSNSQFSENSGVAYTGVIKVYENCTLILRNCEFADNMNQQSVGVAGIGDDSFLYVDNCIFRNNTSHMKNTGALYLENNSNMVVVNSQFIRNKASQVGGAITMYKNCNVEVRDSTFAENSAGDISGCINVLQNSSLIVSNTTFLNNTAAYNGGVISGIQKGFVLITDSFFKGNKAHTGVGGCLVNVNRCNLTVLDSTFEENYSGFEGGAIYFGYSFGTIRNSTFQKNYAVIHAGAVKLENGKASFEHTNFLENTARSEGGALEAKESHIKIINCYLTRNQAKYRSGGVMALKDETTIEIYDSDIIGNSAAYAGGVILATGSSKIKLCNVQLTSNQAQIGGVLSLQSRVKFEALNSVFRDNVANGYAGVFALSYLSNAILGDCTFEHNKADAMAGVGYIMTSTVKLFTTYFGDNEAKEGRSIYFFGRSGNTMLTYRTSFLADNGSVSSNDTNYVCALEKSKDIRIDPHATMYIKETPYASGKSWYSLVIWRYDSS